MHVIAELRMGDSTPGLIGASRAAPGYVTQVQMGHSCAPSAYHNGRVEYRRGVACSALSPTVHPVLYA